ncbi:hypothetical protein ADIWIN_2951 [Winogradskyella psychrotolerans RS-3]|uniref:Uncharacterized protein n=1 Tax=Winogradskyella psychrotolerans RS-3 TaxID=641526 RepID=S7VRV0_9FLAO|nr:hypothetical protein ADIWIN_2951 [Winogradskyella psychrotolerans RS-3]
MSKFEAVENYIKYWNIESFELFNYEMDDADKKKNIIV